MVEPVEGDPQANSFEMTERVKVIQQAISYSMQFRDSWFIVHVSPSSVDPERFSQDLQMLRSLGIHVAAVIAEDSYPEQDSIGVDLRRALNRDDLTAVVLHWDETRSGYGLRRPHKRWQDFSENNSLIVLIRCSSKDSLRAAHTLGVESAASKLLLLEKDWDPGWLPVGGPGSVRPSPDQVRPYLKSLTKGVRAAAIAVEAVEAGISEAHLVPTVGNPHPILVEIFTDTGIGTWIGH
jgi:hypothetical protein